MSAPDRRGSLQRDHERSIDPPEMTTAERCAIERISAAPGLPMPTTLMRRIDRLFTGWPFLGSRLMTAMLNGEGCRINRKRVQRLMRKMGIAPLGPKPRTTKPAQDRVPERGGRCPASPGPLQAAGGSSRWATGIATSSILSKRRISPPEKVRWAKSPLGLSRGSWTCATAPATDRRGVLMGRARRERSVLRSRMGYGRHCRQVGHFYIHNGDDSAFVCERG
ncbi:transposase [Bradyrhizobium sp. Arg68]|nr:transposase [Bradyrhizobium ivorense]